jgi:hypothetical protein
MGEDRRTTKESAPESPPNAVDVVDGPIGSAWLRDPATSGPKDADHDGWPVIETDEGPADTSSSAERQGPDRVGVDSATT